MNKLLQGFLYNFYKISSEISRFSSLENLPLIPQKFFQFFFLKQILKIIRKIFSRDQLRNSSSNSLRNSSRSFVKIFSKDSQGFSSQNFCRILLVILKIKILLGNFCQYFQRFFLEISQMFVKKFLHGILPALKFAS